MSERSFYFNSLPKLYEALCKDGKELEAKKMLEGIFKSNNKQQLDKKIKRFLEIPDVGFIPADEEYFRLYEELTKLYVDGFFYSTIVLAGVLCERICYDIIAKQEIKIGSNLVLSSEQKTNLFDMNLRNLIQLLNDWQLIQEKTKKIMLFINDKRNEYVHPKKPKTEQKKDALELLKKISTIIKIEIATKALPMV